MTDKNLWGNTDTFADVPKFLQPKVTFDGTSDVAANGTFTVPAHPYVNGDKVKYTSTSAAGGFTTGNDYFVVARTADTLQLEATVGGGAIARGTANGTATDSLQKVATDVYFIDQEESGVVRSKGLGTAGWNQFTERQTADGTVRRDAECIVALSQTAAAAGDQENTVTPDSTLSLAAITTPVAVADGATASIAVVPTSNNADAVFSYVWTYDAGGSATPATAITEANHPGFSVGTDGTLTFPAALSMNNDTYKVVVTAAIPGHADLTATSNTVTLNVS